MCECQGYGFSALVNWNEDKIGICNSSTVDWFFFVAIGFYVWMHGYTP